MNKYINTSEEEHKLPEIVFKALKKLCVEQQIMIEDAEASNL